MYVFWFCLMTITLLLACKPSGMRNFGNMQISRGKPADDLIFFFPHEKTCFTFWSDPAFPYEVKNKFHKGKFFLEKNLKSFLQKTFSRCIGIFGVMLVWEAALECHTVLCFVAVVELLQCSMWLVSII